MATRRNLLLGLGAATTVAALGLYAEHAHRLRVASEDQARRLSPRPAGVPVGPFDIHSTAEEVTRGIDLSGKTILVTGVTSGIGLETMRVLALRGAHVIGTGRTLEKARSACASVIGRTTPLMLELTNYASVLACAEAVHSLGASLDGLICNAGVMGLTTLEQVEGIEKQFATNHLGHFLLTAHLVNLLKAAPQGRVVVVSSSALRWADPKGIEFDNLSGSRNYDATRAYGQSKLANALFALELSRHLVRTTATANSLHPGYVDTQLFRHYPRSLSGFRGLIPAGKLPVEQGASTSCYVATAPALAHVSGYFFRYCNPVIPDPRATDLDAADRLWAISEQLLKAYL